MCISICKINYRLDMLLLIFKYSIMGSTGTIIVPRGIIKCVLVSTPTLWGTTLLLRGTKLRCTRKYPLI